MASRLVLGLLIAVLCVASLSLGLFPAFLIPTPTWRFDVRQL